ncbi:hypothetical protein QWT69_02700 [Sporosarcina oncorhynchi]|uniref:SbsA Ig-like domain-containing protein n=1 Tax=Sporosarcina oncorhynchi TaxID=3056444 RepID=A0ABZ0L7A0_9BACL|nr:hypothetical protein [Sporosarcina sp. T2O-4]WOV88049.1 hypothetical protein QWT69_02700 [Sporosarcina sp. T2O-4]
MKPLFYGGGIGTESATNLKEVVVAFDGTVDEDTATDKANYALKSGKAIKSVAISADQKSVTVTLEGTLTNNKTEAISVSNVKAGDVTINEKNVEFNVSDNKLPEVTEIKSLGTKSVKVSFTEPVTDLQQSNFTLDGKAFFGRIDMGAGNKSAILTPFSTSALAVGDHTLTVSGVKDFAGFVSLNSTHDFTVVEDKVAPTIVEATATLESVTITFSEDVDASTVSASKVYWKSGDSKKTATGTPEALADNKYKFTFSTSNPDNSLPTGKVDIFVEGVKDYSGNEIAKDTKVSVTPEIDQTRPEVRKVTATSATEFTVTFSKALDSTSAQAVGNYVVTDKNGKVISVKDATLSADKKSVHVELYTSLSVGENSLTVKNVKDATKLKNTMLDFTGKIVRGDQTGPKFDSKVVNPTNLRVVLKFNEKMDVATLADYSNYLVTINGTLQTLTADMADIAITQDGTAVIISFVETFNGKKVVFTSSESPNTNEVNINKLTVLGVKDAAGNLLQEFTNVGTDNEVPITNQATELKLVKIDSDYDAVAELVDRRTVKVKFSTGINSASSAAFTTASGPTISSIDVDGTSIVTLKFNSNIDTDGNNLALRVNYAGLEDIAGNKGATSNVAITKGDDLLDSVAPVLDGDPVFTADGKIKLTFSEALTTTTNVGELLNSEVSVVRISDNKKLDIRNGYSVAVADGSKDIVIELKDADAREAKTAYRVSVDGAKYITDKSVLNNPIANFSVTTDKVDPAANITGSLAHTTPGVATNPGTPEVLGEDTVTFANEFKANDTVTIDGEVLTLTADAADGTEAAAAVKTLVEAHATLKEKYTVTANAAVLTFKEKTGKADGVALTATKSSAAGTVSATSVTTGVKGVAETPGTAQVETLTVSGTTNADGSIKVKFNDGTEVEKTVAVKAGDTKTQVATKIANAFADLAGWTVTSTEDKVVFTANPIAAHKDNVTVTVTK